MVKIFMVGGTGHIGVAVLDTLLKHHPDLEVEILVRSQDKASRLLSKYPNVKTTIGDLACFDILRASAREANIVINTAPDITHEAGIQAILDGIAGRVEGHKGFYIHTAGASLIWDDPDGTRGTRVWDDIEDEPVLARMDASHTHAVTDKVVRAGWPGVNVAIVSPGFVGGISPSIDHPAPITTPAILRTARAFNSGFQIAGGENRQAWVHVLDLALVYQILVDNALDTLAGTRGNPGPPTWGADAYYFVVSEEVTYTDFMAQLTPVLRRQGVIESIAIQSVSVVEAARISIGGIDYDPDEPPPPADSWAIHIAIMYGVNMRLRPSRLQHLGWKPRQGPIADTFEDVVARQLQLERDEVSGA